MSDHLADNELTGEELPADAVGPFPDPITDIEAEIADLSEGYRPDLADIEISTQEANPGSAVGRTAVQVGVPSFILLGLAVPEIIELTLEQFGDAMPVEIRGWLLASAGVITGLGALGARVMAIPAVNVFLRDKFPRLAPENKGA